MSDFWSVEPSIREVPGGFTLAFSPKERVERQSQLNGEFWRASRCPALVLRGTQSRAVNGAILEMMAKVRESTKLVSIEAGHVIHHDAPASFLAIEEFLKTLPG